MTPGDAFPSLSGRPCSAAGAQVTRATANAGGVLQDVTATVSGSSMAAAMTEAEAVCRGIRRITEGHAGNHDRPHRVV